MNNIRWGGSIFKNKICTYVVFGERMNRIIGKDLEGSESTIKY